MSSTGLTPSAQIRYLLQWFGEFSELQREDFLPVLVAAYVDKQDDLAQAMTALSCIDKPISLFQCRIKLFNEWFTLWPKEEQERLVRSITDMDADFKEKFQQLISEPPKVNGNANGDHSPAYSDVECVQNGINNEAIIENLVVSEEEKLAEENNISESNIPYEITAAS